jgi:hypothetical protein
MSLNWQLGGVPPELIPLKKPFARCIRSVAEFTFGWPPRSSIRNVGAAGWLSQAFRGGESPRTTGTGNVFRSGWGESVEEYGGRLYLFCLLTSHAHLLVEIPRANPGAFMQKVQTAYTVYINLLHSRRKTRPLRAVRGMSRTARRALGVFLSSSLPSQRHSGIVHIMKTLFQTGPDGCVSVRSEMRFPIGSRE